jgi:hypothetical protein
MAPSNISPLEQIKTKLRTSMSPKSPPKASTPTSTATSPLEQIKTKLKTNMSPKASPKASTPSKTDTSPLFCAHLTASPRETETEADKLPKNNNSSNVDTPAKKIKVKTKGISDLALRNDHPSAAKTKMFGDIAWPKGNKLANIVTDATKERDLPTPRKLERNPNTAPPADSPKMLQKCVVCNVPNLGKKDRKYHFKGERHTQVRGLLEVHREYAEKEMAAIRSAAQSSSAVVNFGDGWHCHFCNSPILPQNNDNLMKHLGKGSHVNKLREMWAEFVSPG